MVQEAFPDGWVITERESPIESRYRVELLSRPISIVFRPRADGASVAVALASMLCKYLREICMRQFNRFWAKHIPGLKPTAGYPVDARRFFAEIQPLLPRLGLTDDCVWRKK
jgi:ribonuclease HII